MIGEYVSNVDHLVNQGSFPVVNVGYNGDVSNITHPAFDFEAAKVRLYIVLRSIFLSVFFFKVLSITDCESIKVDFELHFISIEM